MHNTSTLLKRQNFSECRIVYHSSQFRLECTLAPADHKKDIHLSIKDTYKEALSEVEQSYRN